MDIKKIRKFLSKLLMGAVNLILWYGFFALFAIFTAPWIYVVLVSSDFINNNPFLYNNLTYVGPDALVVPLLFSFVIQLVQECLDLVGKNNKFTGPLFEFFIVIIQVFYISLLALWVALEFKLIL
tara:strand:+ start:173 stop:547 length:375 start_codon:yes stop_codon:yes gene_type:complete